MIRLGIPRFYDQIRLWEAISSVSQEWSFPTFRYGSKLKSYGYARFSLWFHSTRCHFGTTFLSHSYLGVTFFGLEPTKKAGVSFWFSMIETTKKRGNLEQMADPFGSAKSPHLGHGAGFLDRPRGLPLGGGCEIYFAAPFRDPGMIQCPNVNTN